MPVHYKSKGLFSLDHIYKWLKGLFRYDRLPPEPERIRHQLIRYMNASDFELKRRQIIDASCSEGHKSMLLLNLEVEILIRVLGKSE